MKEQKPIWAEEMKGSPFLKSHFTDQLSNRILEKAANRTSKRQSTLSIVIFSLTLITILFVAIPNFTSRMPNHTPVSNPDEIPDEQWAIRHSYYEDGNILFTIFPDPYIQAGTSQGYMIHFNAPFEQFQGKTLSIQAVHKETGIQTFVQHPLLITEPSSGYESLGRFTAFFELPLGGTWRHIVEVDGLLYGDAVLAINEPSWEVSPIFISGANPNCAEYLRCVLLRGKIPIGFIDAGFVAGKSNKYMWHFWGPPENIEGDFTVLAVKKGSTQVIEVFSAEDIRAQPLNGADNALPSSMSLPEPGRWLLMPFMNGKLIASIVVEVSEN